MTPSDVDAALPNGFHAVLRRLGVNFVGAQAHLAFDFLLGVPEAFVYPCLEALGLTLPEFIERRQARYDLLNLELHCRLPLRTVTSS